MPLVNAQRVIDLEHVFIPEVDLDEDPRLPYLNKNTFRASVGRYDIVQPHEHTDEQWVGDSFHMEKKPVTVKWLEVVGKVWSLPIPTSPPWKRGPLCGQTFAGRRNVVTPYTKQAAYSTTRRSCFKCLRILAKTYAPEEVA